MTIRALLLLGSVTLALASVASAQSVSPPAANADPPPAPEAPATVPASPPPSAATVPPVQSQPGLPPRIRATMRASGLAPIGPPERRGNLYLQRAVGAGGAEYRLVIDSVTGRIVSGRPMRIAGPYAYGPAPYGPYPPPYRPAYGRYYGPPPDDFGYGYGAPHPPRNIPTARLSPPQSQLPAPSQRPQEAQQQSHQPPPLQQPSTNAQAPLPRPKPYVMEATGSIPIDSPKPLASPLASQKTPEPEKASEPAAVAAQNNGAATLPPVAPLD